MDAITSCQRLSCQEPSLDVEIVRSDVVLDLPGFTLQHLGLDHNYKQSVTIISVSGHTLIKLNQSRMPSCLLSSTRPSLTWLRAMVR